MPLKSLAKIRIPLLDIDDPAWLHAATFEVLGKVGLFVYRSILIRDTDPIYSPVSDLLSRSRCELLRHRVVQDARMMARNGEWSFYLLHKISAVLDDVIDPMLLDELQRLGESIQRELGIFLTPERMTSVSYQDQEAS